MNLAHVSGFCYDPESRELMEMHDLHGTSVLVGVFRSLATTKTYSGAITEETGWFLKNVSYLDVTFFPAPPIIARTTRGFWNGSLDALGQVVARAGRLESFDHFQNCRCRRRTGEAFESGKREG